jgi:hypothetical protein
MQGTFTKEAKDKPFVVSTTLKFSLAPTSKMRKMIKGWRGKDLTADEAKAFVVKKMIGAPCRISLIENEEYINIDSFAKCSKEEAATLPAMINEAIYFSLDPEEFDRKIFDSLSEKTKDKVFISPEYKALIGNKSQSHTEPVDAPFSTGGNPTGGNAAGAPPPASSSGCGTPLTDAEAANQVGKDGKPTGDDLDVPF